MPKSVKGPLLRTLFSGYIGQGPRVEEFEQALANYLGNPYVITVNSGTSALHLALRLANVGPGDEVISTPMTCTATNWPIMATGANIVWADIDPTTANIDPDDIAKKITQKTKAIMVVDWGGFPVDIDKIKKMTHNIPIIEDAAHAFGAIYKGKKVGNQADFTCFSFQAIKHITTVDGGLLTVKNNDDYEKGRLLRWYGIDRGATTKDSRIEIDIHDWGYKFHMNDVAATIGIEQLKFIDYILTRHRQNAAYYDKRFKGLKSVKPISTQANSLSSYWLYTLRVKNRDEFRDYMTSKSVMVSQVHRRNDTHPVVKSFRTKLPKLDQLEKEMICIPVGWWLTKIERDLIADLVVKFDKIA